jgi:CHAT domain-containing protein
MTIRFLFLFCFAFSWAVESNGQLKDPGDLWKKLLYVNDTLRSASESELHALLKVESSLNETTRPDSIRAFLLAGIGHLYYEQGDYQKGVQYYQLTIDLIHAGLDKPWIKPGHLPMFYYRLATIYDSLNQVSEEMKALDGCIAASRRQKSGNIFCLAALYQKTEYYFDVGDYSNCIVYAGICEMLGREYAQTKNSQTYDIGMAYVSSSLIWNAMSNGNLNKYFIADSLLKQMLAESIRSGNVFDLGTIYEQLAHVQLSKGNSASGLDYLHKALAVETKAGHDISCRGILNNIGYSIYLQQYKDYEHALYYYKKALAIKNRDPSQSELDAVEKLNVLANIGSVYSLMGHFDSSFIYFQRALDQIRPGIKESDLLASHYDQFANLKKVNYITSLLIDKGDALIRLYRKNGNIATVKGAIRIYRITDQLLDRMKEEQTDLQSKLFWRADSRRLYEHAIDACYSYQNGGDAFYFFEKSRAVLLNDQLNEQRWLGDDDIRKQTELKKKIRQLSIASEGLDGNSIRYKELQEELFNEKTELDRLISLIKERNPLYYQSFIDKEIITIQDVDQKILNNHRELVEIFSGDSAVFVLTRTSGNTVISKLNKKEFDQLSNSYMSYISNDAVMNRRMNEFLEVSGKLCRLIFQSQKPAEGRIVISPDGQYFPFEALVTSTPGQVLKYFVQDHAVSYTYSAKYLLNSFSDITESDNRDFLGMAPVIYPSDMQLADLKGSDLSLSRLGSNFRNANNLVFSEATRSGFMNQFSRYRIIQLYTHAVADGKNAEPQIFFSDSALSLSELLGENKPATKLIVLSACETGNGKLYAGEGVFGFNRGFAALGIPASISNLWSVDDQSTYRLTELFYKYLAKDMAVDIALQKAKIEFMETSSRSHQLPYYWSAPILIGKSNALRPGHSFSWMHLVILVSVLTAIAFMAYKLFFKSYQHGK